MLLAVRYDRGSLWLNHRQRVVDNLAGVIGQLLGAHRCHLIGFDGDIYGQPLTIEFVARLRDTRKYDSVEDLLAQIHVDVARVKELLKE